MQPGIYHFRVRRSDTERLAVILRQGDVQTQDLDLYPMDGKVAHWTIALPGGSVEKTSADGGGLTYDPLSGELVLPLPAPTTGDPAGKLTSASIPTTPVGYVLRIVDAAGVVDTWLVGTITGEG